MLTFTALLLGIVQGLTEFFPVSSSGHLLIVHKLFPVFQNGTDLSFDVAIHVSTAIVLLAFYGRTYLTALLAFFKKDAPAADRQLIPLVVVATIPAAAIGYFFEPVIEATTRSLPLVGSTLIFGGFLFLAVERWGRKRAAISALTFPRALLIGCGQALALIPGMSRSGMTIIASMTLGLQREAATNFAFLMGVPIILVAATKRIVELVLAGSLHTQDVWLFTVGFVSAGVVGAFCVRFLLNHVKTKTFLPFAYYRITLGALVLLGVLLF